MPVQLVIRQFAGSFDGHGRNHRPALCVEDIDHLFEARRLGIDDVVGQNDGKRLIADQVLGAEHGVA
jgi:hypothetical protein